MCAFRFCIIFFLKMFPNGASLYPLPLHDISSALLPAITTLLSLSLDIFLLKDFQSLLRNIRPSFPSSSAILLNSVHNIQVLSTQSHVRIHRVTRFLESVFPITTSLAEEIELCIYIFCKAVIQYCRIGRETVAEFSKFSGTRPLPHSSRPSSFRTPPQFSPGSIFKKFLTTILLFILFNPRQSS